MLNRYLWRLTSNWFVSSINLLSKCSQQFLLTPAAFYDGPLPILPQDPALYTSPLLLPQLLAIMEDIRCIP